MCFYADGCLARVCQLKNVRPCKSSRHLFPRRIHTRISFPTVLNSPPICAISGFRSHCTTRKSLCGHALVLLTILGHCSSANGTAMLDPSLLKCGTHFEANLHETNTFWLDASEHQPHASDVRTAFLCHVLAKRTNSLSMLCITMSLTRCLRNDAFHRRRSMSVPRRQSRPSLQRTHHCPRNIRRIVRKSSEVDNQQRV